MAAQKLLIVLCLFLPVVLWSQEFQQVTFKNSTSKSEETLTAGQRVKVYVLGKNGYLKSHKGRLRDIRNDSLFIQQNYKITGFALTEIEKIRYRNPFARILLTTLLITGSVAFMIGAVLSALTMLSLGYIGISSNTLVTWLGVGAGILLLTLISSVITNRWIEKPAVNWEIKTEQPVMQQNIP